MADYSIFLGTVGEGAAHQPRRGRELGAGGVQRAATEFGGRAGGQRARPRRVTRTTRAGCWPEPTSGDCTAARTMARPGSRYPPRRRDTRTRALRSRSGRWRSIRKTPTPIYVGTRPNGFRTRDGGATLGRVGIRGHRCAAVAAAHHRHGGRSARPPHRLGGGGSGRRAPQPRRRRHLGAPRRPWGRSCSTTTCNVHGHPQRRRHRPTRHQPDGLRLHQPPTTARAGACTSSHRSMTRRGTPTAVA